MSCCCFSFFKTKLQPFNGFFSGYSILVLSVLRSFSLLERFASIVPIILKTSRSRTIISENQSLHRLPKERRTEGESKVAIDHRTPKVVIFKISCTAPLMNLKIQQSFLRKPELHFSLCLLEYQFQQLPKNWFCVNFFSLVLYSNIVFFFQLDT